MNTIPILGRAYLYSQNSLSYLQYGFHKMSQTFWFIMTLLYNKTAAEYSGKISCCDSPVPSLPKGVLLDSDQVTGQATEINVMFMKQVLRLMTTL